MIDEGEGCERDVKDSARESKRMHEHLRKLYGNFIVSCIIFSINLNIFMKIRYFSDLHIDHAIARLKRPDRVTPEMLWRPDPKPDDSETVLVLAGDLWQGTSPLSFAGHSWLKSLSGAFQEIVVVLGNHDYYKENLDRLPGKWRSEISAQGLDNVHLLEISEGVEAGSKIVDGVRFVGGTLWTSMNKRDPHVQMHFDLSSNGRYLFNDRNYIRAGQRYERFSSSHWIRKHADSVRYLEEALKDTSCPTVIVTHFPLIHHANPARYREGDLSSHLYGNALESLLLDHPHVVGAIHGHNHACCALEVGSAWVRSNPHGYPGETIKNEIETDEIVIASKKNMTPRVR